ncbi:MAG: uroporphyrinogen-III C-methyltransferase [Candidatus Omnitrophota bacterium]|nr:uroporphyrinogen-III C-methyltransferase [Candidatus Omnitrophota bacterium]
MKKTGKIYIIGAGPGDPELITVKALKALKKADTIVYDFLASPELLKLAKKSAKKICVGKADGLHLLEQRSINNLLYKKAGQGKVVARLKGGDPLVFSRGIEEALYLKKKGIEFEIIQGLTSAFAAPESFGIPLTRKGKYSSVAILTGRKSNSEALDAPDCDTIIYLMAVANIENVVRAIIKSGRKSTTPCAFIERGATDKERIVTGNVSNIAKRAREYKIKSPAIFIVGEVVKYGNRLYGYKFKKR